MLTLVYDIHCSRHESATQALGHRRQYHELFVSQSCAKGLRQTHNTTILPSTAHHALGTSELHKMPLANSACACQSRGCCMQCQSDHGCWRSSAGAAADISALRCCKAGPALEPGGAAGTWCLVLVRCNRQGGWRICIIARMRSCKSGLRCLSEIVCT